MATIEVRCKVELAEAIVLATQQDKFYGAIRWKLANGDTATVQMEVSEDEIRRSYEEYESKGNWYVNSRVSNLKVSLDVEQVSEDELDRLYGRHPSERKFVARFEAIAGTDSEQTYQEAPELGRRVATDIREAVNTILRFIRDSYGQHWLKLISDEDPVQNFLDRVHAEWQEGTNPCLRLCVAPPTLVIKGLQMGAVKLYLEISDWQTIQRAIGGNESPPDGFTLLSDSKERFHKGDTRIAIIHLNSALELAVHRFLYAQISSRIPPESLENLLKQTHGRLLSDWVLPLDRVLHLGLERGEWPSIRKVQELRKEAGHPTVSTGLCNLTDLNFAKLVQDATSAVAKLTGIPVPKSPLPMVGAISGGTA